VLHDGWAVCAVFNGVYKRTFDAKTNPETKQFVDDWIALETQRGSRPQVLPTKEKGAWTGSLFVNAADQSTLGEVQVTIEHTPLSLRRAHQQVTWTGALDRSYGFERVRDGARTQYEGPEVFGNATSYGRALFTSQHIVGPEARGVEKIKGREVLIDSETRELAVVWQLFRGDTTTHFVHGLLTWESA
jgi:hypothetical protein